MDNKFSILEQCVGGMCKMPLKESSTDSSKFLYLEGIIQRADSPNKNGRIYPFEILKHAVDEYIAEFVDKKISILETDHPETRLEYNFSTSCGLMEKLWWNGKDLHARVKIIKSLPYGKIISDLVEGGVTVGISSRGTATLDDYDDDTTMVGDDLELLGWDMVQNPSTHEAFMHPVNGRIRESVSRKKTITKLTEAKIVDFKFDLLINEIIGEK